MKIGQKLILGFVGIALLIGVVVYISVNASQKALQESIGESSAVLVQEAIDKIDRDIYYRTEEARAYSHDLTLQKAVKKSNQEFEQLDNIQEYINTKDKEWIVLAKETISPFMEELISNELAVELKGKIEFYKEKYAYPLYGEIFVTNRYGANIAQTGKTSDYYQADEKWWQKAKEDGVYVEDIEYDESAAIYSNAICIKIADEAGNFLGVIKAVLNIEEAISIIKELERSAAQELYGHVEHKTMHFDLVNKDGKLIYSTKKEAKFLEDLSKEESVKESLKREDGYYITVCKTTKDKELFAHAHSKGYKDYKGVGWILIAMHESEEIFAPVARLRNTLLILSGVILIIAISIGLFISHSVSSPIAKLKDAAGEIGKGKLDTRIEIKSKDEIGVLAVSFNQMTEDLKKTTTSIDNLNAANQQLQASEQQFKKLNQQLMTSRKGLQSANEQLQAREQQLKAANQQLQTEIAERKKTEQQLNESLEEKEVLLREIHHRVKNNMQVISSLMRLQARNIEDEKSVEIFRECQNRVKSMALIHTKLYQSESLANIDFAEYVEELAQNLMNSYDIEPGKVALTVDVEKISLGVDLAVPCGLLVNELISNSLKHAFPKGAIGEVKIYVHPTENGQIELTVSDNGVGFPEELDFRKSDSLGMQLITSLVEGQLQGKIELNRSAGTEFKVTFDNLLNVKNELSKDKHSAESVCSTSA